MRVRPVGIAFLPILLLGVPEARSADAVERSPKISRSERPMPVVGPEKWQAHLRLPRDDEAIAELLRDSLYLSRQASAIEVRAAVDEFKRLWAERQPPTPRPDKLRELLRRERAVARWGAASTAASAAHTVPLPILAVPVEFAGTDTFLVSNPHPDGGCVDETITTSGPLHNEIPPPGPRDNNTLWFPDATPELFSELIFGEGPQAGLVVEHPNLGAVDCRGMTMVNYFLEQSEGAFHLTGLVYPRWLQSAHSEAWYGASDCELGLRDRQPQELVREAVDLVNADDPQFPWQQFDTDADGFVDNFTVIHAGAGQESGGAGQGSSAIWSQAGKLDWPEGYLACSAGQTSCPERDIRVLHYSIDPEALDLGVLIEEYGHAAFGLPDLYTNDSPNGIAHWAPMSRGVWNGPLGGMQPAPFPGWFRYLVGWWDPVVLPYDTPPTDVVVGQLAERPPTTAQGVKIDLPDREDTVDNPLGTGQAWWSDRGDLLVHTLTHSFDLRGAWAPVTLSFRSHWRIENGWDYGYVEVSTDGGASWTSLADLDSFLTDEDPNGNNDGWGLTGSGEAILRFSLSDYRGLSDVLVRLRYATDLTVVGDGWWADDFQLLTRQGLAFEDDVESGPGDWTAEGWRIVPLTEVHPRYYLAEWRNASGFDRGLAYAYVTVFNDDAANVFEVDRVPYHLPGALLWLRDAMLDFDYNLGDSLGIAPSYGPKHGLLVVDSHPFPYMWDQVWYESGQTQVIHTNAQAMDAAFTLEAVPEFTLRRGWNAEGQWTEEIQEVKTFGPRPAHNVFHDAIGHYPGFWYPGEGDVVHYWHSNAGLALPAQGMYSTRITDADGKPYYDLYGTQLGSTLLGSGNPGDAGAQFGLHVKVEERAPDGSWGRLRLWNSLAGTPPSGVPDGKTLPGAPAIASYDPLTGAITVEWQPGCNALDHAIYLGQLGAFDGFTQAICSAGTTGTFSFPAPAGSLFWIITGVNDPYEGSYGSDSAGVERAIDGESLCGYLRDTSAACLP